MKTIKTVELIDAVLDWAVAKCEGLDYNRLDGSGWTPDCFNPSNDWAQGGPIIEREIFKVFKNVGGTWTAQIKVPCDYYSPTYNANIPAHKVISSAGSTPLIAAMRCYVASKIGDTVEVPDELTKGANKP